MKKYITKTVSLLLTVLMISSCFVCVSSVAAEDEFTDSAESNFEFSVKTAEIIKKDDNETSMLRIIGKLKNKNVNLDFPCISDCVISEDGRFVLQFKSEDELVSCLEKLNRNPNIIYAERDVPIYTEALETDDECLSWGAKAIEADIYSQSIILTTDKHITVAIVDSGCEDIDFIEDRLVGGYDFVENDHDAAQDDSIDSHGTFIASIVTDCTRTLPVKIMPVRILGSKEGSLINLINGIIYAADNGADVINLSLSVYLNNCKSLENAIQYAQEKDVSIVVCAGNLKYNVSYFCPAHIENVITVSSINSEYEFSESFSNFGDKIDLAAPGENIIGYNSSGELTTLTGTSMSAAFVSAAAAMFRLDNPYCNAEQVSSALISSAEDMGEPGKDDCYGWGVPKLEKLIKLPDIKIKNNPVTKTINYGETLKLTAETVNQPMCTSIYWYIDGVKRGEGQTFEISPESGSVEVSVMLVDAEGNVVIDKNGNEISDSETITVNSGFFQKLISFFKNLFGLNKTLIQTTKR